MLSHSYAERNFTMNIASTLNDFSSMSHAQSDVHELTSLVPHAKNQAARIMRLMDAVPFHTNIGTISKMANRLTGIFANFSHKFNPRMAVSSNSGVVAVSSFNGRDLPDITIRISQIATKQKNVGSLLPTNAQGIPCGEHRFEIEIDGKKHEISFFAASGLSNERFQQKMADAINAAGIGIRAFVSITSKASGIYSALNLEAESTGAGKNAQPRFTIRDTTGSAVSLTGINTIYQEGQNARFSIDGEKVQESSSNLIDLGNGLRVRILKASPTPVVITQGSNPQAMQDGVRQWVRDFNSLLESAKEGDKPTQMFLRSINNTTHSNRSILNGIGVNISYNGFLMINESSLVVAARNGTVERFFTQSNNFISTLNQLVDNL